MGTGNDGTTYGDELISPTDGTARTGGNSGIGSRFRGRVATITGRDAEGEGTAREVGTGARIQTGEQAIGKGQSRARADAPAPERASASDAASAAKSTLSPLRLATRLATMGLGVDASMTPEEQRDILDPLTRIYGRNARIAAYINRYTDPVMLALAVASYVGRILLTMQQTRLIQAQTALENARRQQQPRQQQPQPATVNVPVFLRPETPPSRVPGEPKPEGPTAEELSNMFALGR